MLPHFANQTVPAFERDGALRSTLPLRPVRSLNWRRLVSPENIDEEARSHYLSMDREFIRSWRERDTQPDVGRGEFGQGVIAQERRDQANNGVFHISRRVK